MAELKRLQNGGNYYYFKDAPTHASGITLNKNEIKFTEAGQTEQLVATVTPSDAVEKKVHWSSSDNTIATVSQTGLVTCVTPGTCTITASCDGVSASCIVTEPIYITTSGIYHNSNLGLISLSSDGTTWFTISDKNLGATTSDVTSQNSYGDYYSRGAKQNRNGQSASGYTMEEDRSLGNQTISPTGYHIPTQAEWTSLVSALSSILGISELNYNYAMQYLLLPRSGQMTDSGTTIQYAETSGGGYYWSSTKTGTTSAYILRSTASVLNATGSAINFPRGLPIRVFKNTSLQPDTTRDVMISLLSYSDLKNITYGTDVVTELNKYPSAYYAKLNSEGHLSLISGSSDLYWIVATPSSSPDERPISSTTPYNDTIWYSTQDNEWALGV